MGALSGIRIIDWTVYQQGPVATSLLGALGAEVIKIEQPGVGDLSRGMIYVYGIMQNLKGGGNFYYDFCNLNKKGITLDLTKAKGLEVLHRLVKNSDVFVHNWRTSLAKRLKLDYESLRQVNPRLIYAQASGYGRVGPDNEMPAVDLAAQARSGFMNAIGEPGMPPLLYAAGIADQIGAMSLAFGILAALAGRERQGIGQEVHSSILGAMVWAQGVNISQLLVAGMDRPKHQRSKAANPMYNYYRCKDDKWILFANPRLDRWPIFCTAVGKEELATDLKFATPENRRQNCEEIIRILDDAFLSRTRSEWMERLKNFKDVIHAPVNTYREVIEDPQVIENKHIVELDHPTEGLLKLVGSPIFLSETPVETTPPPMLGQHTEEVLQSVGKYNWEEIESLRIDGII